MVVRSVKELNNVDATIIIFGAGNFGEYAYLFCKKKFSNNKIYFCDNNISKQSNFIHNCKIISPKSAVSTYPNAIYIIANSLYTNEMRRQLIELNIQENQIYIFNKDDYFSILTLDEMWEINKNNYARKTGKILDKENLKTFTEKMQYSKIYLNDPLKTRLTDKYLVKEWIREKIGEEYLIPLLGVYNTVDDIDFEKLPETFVLKTNHGCGMNYIVTDKKSLDLSCLKNKLQLWMKCNYAYAGFELQYKNIKPCIIAEKYIEEFQNSSYDYKFFCFDGKVQTIMIVKNMKLEDPARCFYDRDFNVIPCDLNDGIHMPKVSFEKPKCLKNMIQIAENLSEGIDQVRVDLYAPNGKIYFGEMTFTSWAGEVDIKPKEVDYFMGKCWNMKDPKK